MEDAFGEGTGTPATQTLEGGDSGASTEAPAVPAASPAPEQAPAQEPQPDLAGEVAALRQRVDEALPAAEEGGEQGGVDIVDALSWDDEGEYGTSDQDTGDGDDELSRLADEIEGAERDDDLRARLEALEADKEADNEARRQQGLRDLASEFPELTQEPIIQAVAQKTLAAAERYGDERIANDPFMVRMAYMAHKAETIAAAETPAKPGSGAPVETEMGTSGAQTGSLDNDVVGAMLAAGGKADAFTGGA